MRRFALLAAVCFALPLSAQTSRYAIHGAVNASTTPAYSWNGSAGASYYTLEVAADPAFTSQVVNQPGITATSPQSSRT